MQAPHLLLDSDMSDRGHVSYYYYFLYMCSHLGFVTAIFKPKFYSHSFSSCLAVATGVLHPAAVTQSAGERATENVMYCMLPGDSLFSPPQFSFWEPINLPLTSPSFQIVL